MSAAVDFVAVESLTDAELRQLLSWEPDTGKNPERPLLLAAARNRFPGGRIPIELLPEST